MLRGDYILNIKPITCGVFLRSAQFWDAYTTWNRQMKGLWGSWHWYSFIQHTWSCCMYQCWEETSSRMKSSWLWCFGRALCEGRVCPGCALHSFSWDWAAVACSWGLGPDCTWSQSHVATSVSNAFCCCAWLGDGVLAMNYATSVIHTCIISWLCCSWKPAVSKKFPRTWEKPTGTDGCSKTSSAIQATGTQHPFSFCSVYPKTIKLSSWILIFKTLYGLCLMS